MVTIRLVISQTDEGGNMIVRGFLYKVGSFEVFIQFDDETMKSFACQSQESCNETFKRLAPSIEPLVAAIKLGIKSGIYAGSVFEVLQDKLDEAVDEIVLIERIDLPQTKTK